jgi:mono/diheme cytochrome c family protein
VKSELIRIPSPRSLRLCGEPLPTRLPPRTIATVTLLLTAGAASLSLAQTPVTPPSAAELQSQVRPILTAACTTCHSAERQVGGVDLTFPGDPASVLRQRGLWRRVAEQIEAGTMPPKGSRELTKDQRDRLLRWSRSVAEYLDPNDPANRDPGPSTLRRLTPAEYNRTIKDLFGIDFDAVREVGLPEPDNPTGFDNLAAALSLSPALLEKYLSAADVIAQRVFEDPRGKPGKDALIIAQPAPNLPEREAAKQIVARLVRRAYRRPAREVEIERLLKLYDRAAMEGGGFEAGIRGLLKPVLVSPHFLFRVEEERPETHRVTDHELAVRLSYFLWSASPDDTLAQLADSGNLSDAAALEGQIRRMLADPKARALTEGFGEEWLELDRLRTARPSTEFFPAFNGRLKQAMHQETSTFLDKLREEDRSILDLLHSDYTYLNAELAQHYGIPGVTGKEMQRVPLRPEYRRGGILGMGSILAATSHTFRTSPTLRGEYVLDVLLGTPPPPPPPNAAGMLKEKREVKSFRDLLAQHASSASCSGCHRKMDPLGFALDNYNAVGAWRESTPEVPLDVSGELPGGEKFQGVDGLKRILMARKGQFARNMAGRLLSYALGRELVDSDEWTLRQVVAGVEKREYRFSELVLGVVKSVPFQQRRGIEK